MLYRCSRYNNNGKEACSTHTIDTEMLECVILKDIQHAEMAAKNERKLFDRLLTFSGEEQKHEKAAQEKALRDATNRVLFIEAASKRLFEKKITGNVPDSLFKNMLSDYEREINELEEQFDNIRRQPQDQESGEGNAQKWMELIKSRVSIDRLDRATAFQLIDHVLVWVAAMLDKVTGAAFIRTAVVLFYIANEGLSILENTAAMGVPYPKFIKTMLETMKDKNDDKSE